MIRVGLVKTRKRNKTTEFFRTVFNYCSVYRKRKLFNVCSQTILSTQKKKKERIALLPSRSRALFSTFMVAWGCSILSIF